VGYSHVAVLSAKAVGIKGDFGHFGRQSNMLMVFSLKSKV